MRFLLIPILTTLIATSSFAQSKEARLEVMADRATRHVRSILKETELLGNRAADSLIRYSDRSDIVMQGTIQSYVSTVDSVRAALFLDKHGVLTIDSTGYPATPINLSKRSYFKKAMLTKDDRIVLNAAEIGKQSGVPFVPVSRAVRDAFGNTKGVLTMVVTPEYLTRGIKDCNYCLQAVITDEGKIMATDPAGIAVEQAFISTILSSAKGLKRHAHGEVKLITAWRKLEEYGVIVAVSRPVSDNRKNISPN